MFNRLNQEYSKKNLNVTGEHEPAYNYNRGGDGYSQNQSFHHLPTSGNAHNQSMQYATSNAYFCEEHNDPVTNYCANLDCLRPLCPDCIDAHFKFHLQSSTIAQIESIKNMKINCSKKVETAILSLQKEMNDCELKYLLDPEQIINEGVAKINHTKEKVLLMVRKFFEMQEEIYIKRVNENLLRAGDFNGIFDKINTLINELDQLKYSLESNSFLSAINRICRLDLISLRDRFKSDIHKIVQQRDLDPVQVLIDDQKVMQLKQDLDQTVIMAKQGEQHRFATQNALAKQSNAFQQVQNDFQNQSQRVVNDLINPSPLKGTGSNFNTTAPPLAGKGPRERLDIQAADYFDEECKKKNLHFFTYDPDHKTGKLMFLDLNTKQTQFQQINLDLDFAIPEFHKSVALPDGEIYLIGGTKSDKTKSNAIYHFDTTSRKLIKEGDVMKEGRSSFGVCILRNCIYVIGGIGSNGQYLNSCERFNLKTKRWETISALNQASASFSCTSYNNRFIFKIGGKREDKTLLRTIEKYDVMQNKWYTVNIQTNTIPQFLAHSSCVQINQNEIFVFGGNDQNENSSNLSFILHIEEIKDSSQTVAPSTKEENYVYTIQKINQQPLPIAECFQNPQAIILNNTVRVLQDATSSNPNEMVEDKRAILQFNGKSWIVNRE